MPDKPKVLLVERDAGAALPMASAVRQRGWEVVAATDPAMAMSVAMKSRPDAVVVNSELPGGGALTAIKRMRSSVHTAVTPVIAVGSYQSPRKQELNAAGVQECLDAPLEPATVCGAIEKHLSKAPPVVREAPADALRSAARLSALAASGLLDSAPEAAFDRVTGLVARLLGTPMALLSLVDKDRQFFKSFTGLGDPGPASGRRRSRTRSASGWYRAASA